MIAGQTDSWRAAYQSAAELLEKTRPGPIDMAILTEIHCTVVPESNPYRGKLRDKGAVVRLGGAVHRVAPPLAESRALCQDLLGWLDERLEASYGDPVADAREFMFRITEAHPFVDGNGRLGRAVATWLLTRNGYELVADPRAYCRDWKYHHYRALGRRQGRLGLRSDPAPWDRFVRAMVAHCFRAPRVRAGPI